MSEYKEVPCKWCEGNGWRVCRHFDVYGEECPDAYDCRREDTECEQECEYCGGDGIQLQKMSPLEQLARAADDE